MFFSALRNAPSIIGYRGDSEEPEYTVVDYLGRVVIRRYEDCLAAEVNVTDTDAMVARQTGFSMLAKYIFGDNVARSQIAMTAPVAQSPQQIEMTAPVAQQAAESGWRIRFFLPRKLTLANAPKPNDPNVRLVSVSPEHYAVLRFTGRRDQAAVDAKIDQLQKALNHATWQAVGEPAAWFYDPPWTLSFMRRNEVAVAVHSANDMP